MQELYRSARFALEGEACIVESAIDQGGDTSAGVGQQTIAEDALLVAVGV